MNKLTIDDLSVTEAISHEQAARIQGGRFKKPTAPQSKTNAFLESTVPGISDPIGLPSSDEEWLSPGLGMQADNDTPL